MTRRVHVLLVTALAFAGLPASTTPAADPASPANEIVRENRRPGSTAWRVPATGKRLADDVNLQVRGYADRTSVDKGETIGFHITVNPAQKYLVQVFRIGYYGGKGGRQLARSGWRDGTPQGSCVPPGDHYLQYGLIECDWSVGWRLTIPRNWVSGMYWAVLTNEQGYQSVIPFVVRDDARSAPILVAHTFTTYQAYNQWPDDGKLGKSLYVGHGPKVVASDGTRAVKVSFDRPFHAGGGAASFLAEAVYAIRWLERDGYDVTYADGLDLHTGAVDPARYRVYVSPSHDEYWSKPMYDRLEAAQQGCTHLAFLTANNIYWQVRFEPSVTGGRPNRVMVAYKNAPDPVPGELRTARWRDVGRPEQRLLGSMYVAVVQSDSDWVAQDVTSFMTRGTDLGEGTPVARLVGGEADMVHANYPLPPEPRVFYRLSWSPFIRRGSGATKPTNTQQSTLYQASNGAWVFDAGTFNWPKALDRPGYVDVRVQRMTANLLVWMLHTGSRAAVRQAAGADRYRTAARISADAFGSGVRAAYVANGERFPDALPGAAAGAPPGPLLPVGPTLSPQLAIDILRLDPSRAAVVGGLDTVSAAVVSQVRALFAKSACTGPPRPTAPDQRTTPSTPPSAKGGPHR